METERERGGEMEEDVVVKKANVTFQFYEEWSHAGSQH